MVDKLDVMKKYFLGLRLDYWAFHRLGAISRKSGRNKSEIIRDLLNCGYVKERIKREHIDLIRKLAGEANNLNQIARQANTFGYSAVANQVEQISSEITRIIKQLKDDS